MKCKSTSHMLAGDAPSFSIPCIVHALGVRCWTTSCRGDRIIPPLSASVTFARRPSALRVICSGPAIGFGEAAGFFAYGLYDDCTYQEGLMRRRRQLPEPGTWAL